MYTCQNYINIYVGEQSKNIKIDQNILNLFNM